MVHNNVCDRLMEGMSRLVFRYNYQWKTDFDSQFEARLNNKIWKKCVILWVFFAAEIHFRAVVCSSLQIKRFNLF